MRVLSVFLISILISLQSFSATKKQVRQWQRSVQKLAKMKPSLSAQEKRWTLIKRAIQLNKNQWAVKSIKYLQNSNTRVVSKDQLRLNLARTYYQMGYLSKAITEYDKINADSSFWFLAMEEKAWAFLRKSKEEDTLSVLKTVHNDIFGKLASSESYYLAALANYRVCDYKKVFETTKSFQKNFIPRVQALEKIAKRSITPSVATYLKLFEAKKLDRTSISKEMVNLPSLLLSDKELSWLYNSWKNSGRKVLSNKRKKQVINRLMRMAKMDLKTIERNLNLLQLVEAEVIQRIHFVDESSDKLKNDFPVVDGKENLSFPVDENEIWLDELDNYKFSLKTCPSRKGGGYVKK